MLSMENKKWFEIDWSQELAIFGIIAVALSGYSNPVVIAVVSGLIGYLKGKNA